MNFENVFDRIQMTNIMIMFQILGLYDQMSSHGTSVAAKGPKRRLEPWNEPSTQFRGIC